MRKDYLCKQLRGYEQVKDGLFGIEVEVEGDNLPKEIPKYWKIVKDGSLRGESAEYVLKAPLSLPKTEEALTILNNSLKEAFLYMSFRTSVHVHVNIQEMFKSQFNRFIYTSFLVEDLLVEFSGEGRIGNRFCLRVRDAEAQLRFIKHVIKTNNAIARVPTEEGKYSAINLCPAATYGSIEFRSMQGTTDKETILTWVKLLNKIRDFSINSQLTLKELTQLASENPEGFMISVFGETAPLLMFKGYEFALKDADSRMFDIAFEEEPLMKGNEEGKAYMPMRNAAGLQAIPAAFQEPNPFEPREIEFEDEEEGPGF